MKKNTIVSLLTTVLFGTTTFSQVGINTQSPEATLDIRGKNHNGAVTATDGVLVPRVNSLAVSGSINGQLVYLIADTTSPAFTKGFYYWNGSSWTGISGGGTTGDSSPDAWVDNSGNVVLASGSVGIGTTAPDASSLLDMAATDKGVLFPRVALASSTDQTTIPNPALGLLVFNTGTGTLKSVGYLFWNGTEWRTINNSTTVNPSISGLNCGNASIFPKAISSTVVYSGTLTVPYSGGNGGSYPPGTSFTSNGLKFTLQPGSLNYGAGTITYSVESDPLPAFSSPTIVSIPLNFLGKNCNVSIGDNTVVKSLTYGVNSFNYTNTNYETVSITTMGPFQFKIASNPFTNQDCNISFRFTDAARTNVQTAAHKNGGGTNWDSGANQTLSTVNKDQWYNVVLINDGKPNIYNSDVATFLIIDTEKRIIYRISFGAVNLTSVTGKGTIFIEVLDGSSN